MKKFWKDKKGAVTVLVTLLLIPALLVSGTGVDLARIYTARSVVQDANQLAANAAMTQYDAMLQDLYGLFAISTSDPDLQDMVSDYVNLSIYGTKDPGTASGGESTFQLFSGSVTTTSVSTSQSLGEIATLRHQIEEYAKFRAPVAIADEIIDRLKSFEKLKANSEAIKDKVAIDGMVGDLQELCRELYTAINDANAIRYEQQLLINELNALLDEINQQMKNMEEYRKLYEATLKSDGLFKAEELEEYRGAYLLCTVNIVNVINNNSTVRIYEWKMGSDDDNDGEWEYGDKEDEPSVTYDRSIEDLIAAVKDPQTLTNWLNKLDTVVRKCETFDQRSASIETECKNLEDKLNSGECDEALTKQIQEEIALYKELINIEAKKMAEKYYAYNKAQLEYFVEDFRNIVYGSISETNDFDGNLSLSLSSLATPIYKADDAFEIEVVEKNKTRGPELKRDEKKLHRFASLKDYHYSMYYALEQFQNVDPFGEENRDFYIALSEISKEGDENKANKAKGNIAELLKLIQEELKGIMDYFPQGAGYYKAADTSEDEEAFGTGEGFTDTEQIQDEMSSAMDKVSGFADVLENAAERILQVAYVSEMFSCFTDDETVNNSDAKIRISLSGVPMDTNVNYFYQSELEYLYNGNLGSAAKNLAAVSGTILLIRFVFNYIATFTVEEVVSTIRTIKSAFSTAGPIGSVIGIAIGELARVAFALGESVLDVGDLRNGDPVPLTKNDTTWKLSLFNLAEKAATELTADKAGLDSNEYKSGLYYIDYLRLFLLLKDPNTIASRTSDLIELNVTNAKNSVYNKGETIYGNEKAITSEEYFELDTKATTIQITTEVELRYLFFSMGHFQKGVNSIVPPKTQTLTVVDYRGY